MIGDLQRTKIILNQSSDNSLIPGSIPTSSRPRPSSRPRTGDPSPPSLFACLFEIILWQSRKHLCAPFSVLTFLQILAPRASRTWPSCTPRGRPSPPSRRATRSSGRVSDWRWAGCWRSWAPGGAVRWRAAGSSARELGRRQPLLLRLGEVQVEQLALELE